MPIVKEVITPNGAATTFHKVVSISFSGDFSAGKVQVTSWRDQPAYLNGAMPAWNWYPEIPHSAFDASPVASAEAALVADGGLFSAGQIVVLSDAGGVESVRARKNAEINAARWLANNSTFPYGGKQIAVDPLSRSDLDSAAVEILNQGSLPAGWPNVWKAVDNTYVSVSSIADWKALYHAMYQQGLDNFVHAQSLKEYVNDPTRTAGEIDAVYWGVELP